MHNPERPSESEPEPNDLRNQLKNTFRDEFESVAIEGRKITNLSGQRIDTETLETEGRGIAHNFRIRFSRQPDVEQLEQVDQTVIKHLKLQYGAKIKQPNGQNDEDIERDEKTAEGRQRFVELVSDEKNIIFIRTNHGASVEITTEITKRRRRGGYNKE